MANRYDLGDLVRVTGTWTDPLNSDAAIDPSKVYCTVTAPDGDATTYEYIVDSELVRSGTGVYYVDVAASEEGIWKCRFYSTGTGQAAELVKFIVDPS